MNTKPIPKRISAFLLCFALLVGLLPTSAWAAENEHNISTSTLTISQNGSYTVTGTTSSNRIIVNSGVTATVILNNVNITGTAYDIINGDPASSPIDLGDGATLTLILSDNSTNTLTGGAGGTDNGAPGIHVPSSATLTIQGDGVLNVTGGSANMGIGGPGIGGQTLSANTAVNGESCGTVIILGGTIQINGGTGSGNEGAVGIGGSDGGGYPSEGGDGGTVIILSDTVTVTGGEDAVDIGGGIGTYEGSNGQGIRPNSDGTYNVYGNLELPCDITIPEGITVNIPGGTSLEVPDGSTLTNNGTITGQGSLTGEGTVTNNGEMSVTNNDFMATVAVSANPSSAAYHSSVTLTANVTNGNSSVSGGSVTFYQGDANGTALNTTGANVNQGTATYTISALDWTPGSYTITAVYTPAEGSSLIESSGTTTLTVNKAAQTTSPDAPSGASSVTATSITLNTVSGSGEGAVQYGYTTDGGSSENIDKWQNETTFNNLTAATAYTFYARYAGNENYEPSNPSSTGTTIHTAYAAPGQNEGYTINYATETVTANSGYEVRLTENDTWGTGPINITPGGTFQVRHAETEDGAPASEGTTVNVAARPNAPTLTIDNEAEGVMISAEYYYSFTSNQYDNGNWTQGTGEVVHVDPEATIYIYKASVTSGNDAAFKSQVQTLTAPARASTPTVPTIDYEDEALSGTTTAMEYAMGQNVPSQWTACTANMTLEDLGWNGGALTVQFRTAATTGADGKYASNPVSLAIPARPAAPAAPTATDWTDDSITITTVSGVQYRLGEDDEWESGTDGSLTFDNLTAETPYTIYARTPASSSQFASAAATFQITTKTSAAAAPTVGAATVTDTTITLPYDAAWEYSTDQQSWSGTREFTGLTAATQYTYYVRVAETSTAEASEIATVTVYTAHTTPAAGEGYSIDYGAETISVTSGYEVNTAADFTGTAIQSGASLSSYIGGAIYIRHTGTTGGAPASAGTAISLARPAAPAVQGANESVQGREDGKITGLTAGTAYEISDDDGLSWGDAALTGTEITGLAPDTYQVRAKSTANSFSSTAAVVVIGTGDAPTYTLNVTAPTFESVYTGYTQPEAETITIISSGNSDAAISGVTVSSTDFTIGGSGSTVPAGESITTWTIRPAAGLGAGTHTATITVTYNNGATATAEVSFVVNQQSSGGGGGGTTTYPPTVSEADDGAVSISPKNPERGDTVTITATPKERYEVEEVTVTDRSGNEVEVTLEDDGTYTFVQPAGKVTIDVTFDVDMPFTDVPEDAWYIEGAKYVYGNFIMSGTGPTTFDPSGTVSRGMIVQILYNLEGQPDIEEEHGFSDVPEGYWSSDAIAWAVEHGVVGGYGNGTFGPDNDLTREQMAVILFNYANSAGYDTTARRELSGFTDVSPNGWARTALEWAYAEGLLTGTSGTTMSPAGQASRAQIAVIMMRFCERFVETAE